jgi:hypothetical protein
MGLPCFAGMVKISFRSTEGKKKRAARSTWALYSFEGNKTSRGEQLLRWHWEEKATKMHQLRAI